MVIAGPNPSIDRLIGLDRFNPGHIHRAERVEARIGGGGINAARVASRLGASATLVTVLPEIDERRLAESLAREGVSFQWVRGHGQVRVATIVREREGRMSVLNEPGADLDVREWEAFTRIALGNLTRGRVLLCSGSLPPGAPADGYARMAREARHLGSRCLVDAAAGTLEATLEAREGLVVPNLAEAESVLNGPRAEPVHPVDAPERARAAAEGLLRRGAHAAVVTAGGAGAAYAERGARGARGWVVAPDVAANSPIGAGDAFAAGLALRVEGGAPLAEAVAYAVAVAAAHVEGEDGQLRPERVQAMREGGGGQGDRVHQPTGNEKRGES
jgi:1-phosphofructokinase family hexose kinase